MDKISNKVFLSIIVPVYNNRQGDLLRCLKSLSDETGEVKYEIILVDDGSKRDCAIFLDETSRNNNHISVIHQTNQGPAIARNTGLKAASGKYILFVDADDIVPKQFWYDLHNIALQNYDFDVVYGLVQLKSIKNNITKTDTISRNLQIKNIDQVNYKKLYRHMIDLGVREFNCSQGHISRGPIARLVSKELAVCHPFNSSLFHGEDQIWNLDLLNNAKKIGIVSHCWYYYIENPNSITHNPDPRYIEWQIALIKTLSKYICGPRLGIAFGNRIFESLNEIAKTMYLPTLNKKNFWEKVSEFGYLSHMYPFNSIPNEYLFGGVKPFLKWLMYKTKTLIIGFELNYIIHKVKKRK